MTSVLVEIRRQLHRRSVWWLLLVAGAFIVLVGVVSFLSADDETITTRIGQRDPHPALMQYWWTGRDDAPLLVGMLFLFIGAIIGGATATGGEWRNGTVPALLVWEPRRTRFALARLAACAVCAAVIGAVLQLLLLAAFLPSVVVHGTTQDADAAWFLALIAAVGRASLVAALAATLAAALGLAFRHTAAALGVLWVWLSVLENLARGVKPWSSRYLVIDNVARFVSWADVAGEGPMSSRSPAVAGLLLASYMAVVVGVVVRAFARSDAVAA